MSLRSLVLPACAALAALCAPAAAQDRPPMRVILPVSAGSGVDTMALGQPVVVENLPGAGGITGTTAIVRSRNDGNNVGLVSNNHVINPSVYSKMPFDSVEDITPITVIGTTPLVIVVNPQGLPNYEAEGWFAVIGPAKLPSPEVKRIHAAVVTAFADPDLKANMDKQGNVINPSSPEDAVKFFRAEIAKYGQLVKKAGIKLD
jgi:tripartite-type tricarboxylate transporter receptor subunit TctC